MAASARPPGTSRAWELLRTGRPAEAEAECGRVLATTPLQGETLLCLGLARRAQGQDALAALEAAGRALPDDAQVHYVLAQALGVGPVGHGEQNARLRHPHFAILLAEDVGAPLVRLET